MARKKQKSKPPFLRRGTQAPKRLSTKNQLRNWFRKYPALRVAYAETCRRFEGTEGICGIGVGRKFSESMGRYGVAPESTGGFCIKVFVERKKKEVSGKQRIPSWIDVQIKGERKKMRILLDVVSVGGKGRKRPIVVLQQGIGWPQGRWITPGGRFAFGKKPGSETDSLIFSDDQVYLGTTGAVIRYENDSYYGISAGHVFADACSINAPRPDGVLALGVKTQEWERIQRSDLWPEKIKTTKYIRDLILFPIPDSLRPDIGEVTWPDGFLKELATPADIKRAVLAETSTGFIWVDRNGHRPESIPVDLEAGVPLLSLPVDCHGTIKQLTYVMAWPLRFLSSQNTTVAGDSGSPVFLWTQDNAKCRLLGMHVLEQSGHAYAMDASGFFSEILQAKLNKDVWFV